jgi:hypothetical protein
VQFHEGCDPHRAYRPPPAPQCRSPGRTQCRRRPSLTGPERTPVAVMRVCPADLDLPLTWSAILNCHSRVPHRSVPVPRCGPGLGDPCRCRRSALVE